ncbi:hypothetical protein RHMOL_RhmolMtG0009400 (mitochondrion) [Rhododendron molle]|nr:hypothetical protein RHMOL_RhmolMtG0009400 [Rhododendron molle]
MPRPALKDELSVAASVLNFMKGVQLIRTNDWAPLPALWQTSVTLPSPIACPMVRVLVRSSRRARKVTVVAAELLTDECSYATPVHDWLMEVLARIPINGTFHQTAPLDRLVGSSTSYSFDLKSATDRWPLYFLFEVFQAFFDRSFASAVVNSALAFNIFEMPFVRGKPSYVSVRCLLKTHHPYGLMAVNHRYPCRRFSTLARVGGAGYQVLARLDHYRNRHDSRVYAMYTKPRPNHHFSGSTRSCFMEPKIQIGAAGGREPHL